MITEVFNKYRLNLVENEDDIRAMLEAFKPEVAVGIDTETSGLDYTKCETAGYCFSGGSSYTPDGYQGYYIPVRHTDYPDNLPLERVTEVAQHLLDTRAVYLWNRNFDFTFMEKDGVKIPFVGNTHDGQVMAYLASSEPYPALKEYARTYLKVTTLDYASNNAKDNSFASTDPRTSFVYAAFDPLITVLVSRKLWAQFPYIHKIYNLDNFSAEAMRRLMRDATLYLNFDYLESESKRVAEELERIKQEIFAITGYTFNPKSGQEKAKALSRFVTLTEKTAKGTYTVKEEILEQIDHPLAKLFVAFNKTEKYRNSYIDKYITFPKEGFKVYYSGVNAVTGRLSSSASSGNSFFANINIQNVPKTESQRYVHRDTTMGYALSDNPFNPLTEDSTVVIDDAPYTVEEAYVRYSTDNTVMIGGKKVLSFRKTEEAEESLSVKFESGLLTFPLSFMVYVLREGKKTYIPWGQISKHDTLPSYGTPLGKRKNPPTSLYTLEVEGGKVMMGEWEIETSALERVKCKAGFRDVFLCPPQDNPDDPWVWLSGDYASQELRLAANLSKEENLLRPIEEGKDVHTYVAKQIFGYENPEHRSSVKILNFSVLYGAKEFSVAQKLNKTKEEAKELLAKYFGVLKNLAKWQATSIREAKRTKMVYTYFGRPRTLHKWFSSSNWKDIGLAERTALNHPIQGCIPLSSWIQTEDSVIPLNDVLGKRVPLPDGKIGLPTHRGDNEPVFVLFRSGDFLICDFNHKFVYGSFSDPKEISLRSGLMKRGEAVACLLAPLARKKYKFNKYLFKPSSFLVSYLKLLRKREGVIKNDNRFVMSALFRLALFRHRFGLTQDEMLFLPSLCNLYGYALKYNPYKDYFYIRFRRKKKSKLFGVRFLQEEGVTTPVGSLTVLNGLPMYATGGVMSKNTGADILRMVLIRVQRMFDAHPELHEKIRFVNTVHDELNFFVRQSVLQRAAKWLYKITYFKPDNFRVPIVVSLSVGADWGHQLDVNITSKEEYYLGNDNKIHNDKFEN